MYSTGNLLHAGVPAGGMYACPRPGCTKTLWHSGYGDPPVCSAHDEEMVPFAQPRFEGK